uniref:Major facilitator superfamily (MFS) profile domain-containing protein n=1 Tax=Kalanchoe fedtschenkoi TaxID=63787 RepID=A0A7N0TV05_KALFE
MSSSDRARTTMEDMEKGENSGQEGALATPLITPRHSDEDYYSDTNSGISSKIAGGGEDQIIWMVYLSTLVALCGSFEFGICAGYSSPTQAAITKELGLSTAQFSLFGSIATCGAMVGALTSGSMADLIGRKGTMAISSCTSVAGWITIYFSKGVMALDVGRLLTGYGMGVFSYVVPVFIAEITPKHVRGAFTTLNMVTLGCGLTATFALGAVLTWRNLALIGFSSTLGSVVYSSFQVAMCSLTATRMDNTGRKPFLLVSASGMLIGCVLVGTSFFLKVHQVSSASVDAIAVVGLMVYGGSYASGMGAIPWILMSEMFPVNVKGVAGSLASFVDWIGAWTISYTFNYLILWSSYGTFLLYAAVNVLAILFVLIMVPETKGKSLEAIQTALNI